jgi:Domain of unknown function (DUF4129)
MRRRSAVSSLQSVNYSNPGIPLNRKVPTALLLVVLTPGMGAFGQQKAGSSPPLSLSAYAAEMGRWSQALQGLKDHPEKAATLQKQLPPSWPVMTGSARVEVSTDWLRAGLEGIAKNPKTSAASATRLLAHLEALGSAARDLEQAPEGTDASAREKLKAILARPEFRAVHGPTWFDHLLDRLGAWLGRWMKRLSFRISGHRVISNLALWILLIAGAGALLTWMVARLLDRSGAQRLDLPLPQEPGVRAWQQVASEARRAAAAAEYRDAIRLAYWAAIYHLDELGLWTVDHTRTHREHLRLVRFDQPQREPLAALTRQFELAWYAAQPASANDFESAVGQLEKLGCA